MMGALANAGIQKADSVKLSSSGEEVMTSKGYFAMMDTGGGKNEATGKVSFSEFRAHLLMFSGEERHEKLRDCNPWQKKKVQSLFESIDKNEDDFIDEQEWTDWASPAS